MVFTIFWQAPSQLFGMNDNVEPLLLLQIPMVRIKRTHTHSLTHSLTNSLTQSHYTFAPL